MQHEKFHEHSVIIGQRSEDLATLSLYFSSSFHSFLENLQWKEKEVVGKI